ncbi:MAG: diaminopimelate epimerase [Actinomycetes bacterium]
MTDTPRPAGLASEDGPGVPFAKGHGTGNDFVVLPDPQGRLDLGPDQVRALCDRRTGVGADGVLRVVRTTAVPGWEGEPVDAWSAGPAEWFMDYRNSDGSVAEMCGNGIRVFARYLLMAGLVDRGATTAAEGLAIGTRAGVRRVRALDDGWWEVAMGPVRTRPGARTVTVGGRAYPGTAVTVGNPHVVVQVADLAHVGDLHQAPVVSPSEADPDGVNVEFVTRRGPYGLALRVYERGVGETRSCGTGACAAVAAMVHQTGSGAPGPDLSGPDLSGVTPEWTVRVPGGTLRVRVDGTDQAVLAGPAVLVATGRLDPGWWAAATAAGRDRSEVGPSGRIGR